MTQKPAHRWHAYHTAAAWGGLVLLLPFILLPLPEQVSGIMAALVGLAAAVTGLGALVAYPVDSRQDNGFSPIWWLWGGAHLLVGAPFIAPLYLIRRALAVGGNSYENTLFSAVLTKLRS